MRGPEQSLSTTAIPGGMEQCPRRWAKHAPGCAQGEAGRLIEAGREPLAASGAAPRRRRPPREARRGKGRLSVGVSQAQVPPQRQRAALFVLVLRSDRIIIDRHLTSLFCSLPHHPAR